MTRMSQGTRTPTLALLLAALAAFGLPLSNTVTLAPCLAKSAKAESAQSAGKVSGTGLDARTLKLVNLGNWAEACKRLETLTDGKSSPASEHGWLAFSYLFLNRCDDLKKLDEKFNPQGAVPAKPSTDEDVVRLVIRTFDLTCQSKYTEAQEVVNTIPSAYSNNCLANFTCAAVAGKQGQPKTAAKYCQKAVEAAPDFGWGYRTLGYLDQRWMKDTAEAEQAYAKALAIAPDFAEVRDTIINIKISRYDYDGALDEALAALKYNSKDPANHYRLALIYVNQWRLREALNELTQALALDPNDARYYRERSNIRRYQGDLAQAIVEQQKAVDLAKDKPFELVELANMNLLAGNTNRAAENLKDALKIDPNNQTAQDKLVKILVDEKRYDDLIALYKGVIARKPKDAKAHMGLATALLSADKPDEAVTQLVEAANLDGNDPEPHRQMGAIHIRRKEFGLAAKEYTKALNINANSVPDLVALGFSYAQNDDYMQAETAFITALALQQFSAPTGAAPTRADIMRSLGALFIEEGRYGDAVTQFETVAAGSHGTPMEGVDKFMWAQARALRDTTDSSVNDLVRDFEAMPEADQKINRYGLVEALLTLKQTARARAQMDKVPEDEKNTALWLTAGAQVLKQEGNLDKAEEMARKAAETKTDTASIHSDAVLALSQVLSARGNLDAASQQALKAVEAYPKSFAAYTENGRIALKRKDVKTAMESAKKAIELDQYYTPAFLLMGDAQMSGGAAKDACDSYQKAAELYPGLIEAHKSLLECLKQLAMSDAARKEAAQIAEMQKRK